MRKDLIILVLFVFCYSLTYSQAWIWGTQGIGSNKNINNEGISLAIDKTNNVYQTGWFEDTLTFGKDSLISYNNPSLYLTKYDPNGKVLWARQSKNTNNSLANAFSVITDLSNNIYVTGYFSDTIIIGSTVLRNSGFNYDVFLAKYDMNGNFLWAKQSVSRGVTLGEAFSVTCDLAGYTYLTGYFQDTVTFGAYKLSCPQTDVFIVKYDQNGNVIWAKAPQVAIPGAMGYSLAADKFDNIYITGSFAGTMHFGSTILTTGGGNAVFLSKYDSAGNVLWAKQSTQNSEAQGNVVAIDVSGNPIITGYYSGADLIFGNDTLPGSTTNNILYVKYSGAGSVVWAKAAISIDSYGWSGHAIAVDTFNNIYLSGGSTGFSNGLHQIKFDTSVYSITTTSTYDPAILVKLDTLGKVMCGSIAASGGDDQMGLAALANGSAVYFGSDILQGQVVFGKDTIGPPANGEWPFLAKWQPCDVIEAVNTFSSSSNNIKVFPNPSNGVFTIESSVLSGQSPDSYREVEIYNVFGQRVYEKTLRLAQGDNKIDISNQPSGIYLYRLTSKEGILIGTGKLIIN